MAENNWNKCWLAMGITGVVLFVGSYIGSKTAPYNPKFPFQEEPKNTIEDYVEEFEANTYIDELQMDDQSRSCIEEMYKLEECIRIIDLLTDLKLKEYEQYIPLTEEEKSNLKELTYDEISILIENYRKQESTSYEGERTKEILERGLSYLLLEKENFVKEEGQSIVIQFGEILLQSSVAQGVKDDPINYEEYVLSFSENVVEHQDEVLGNMVVHFKKNSTFAKVREILKRLKEEKVDYGTLKEAIDYYKYVIISNPVYENGILKDEESWYRLHKKINE